MGIIWISSNIQESVVTILSCVINFNIAYFGGFLYGSVNKISLSQSNIANNYAEYGGVFNVNSFQELEISES